VKSSTVLDPVRSTVGAPGDPADPAPPADGAGLADRLGPADRAGLAGPACLPAGDPGADPGDWSEVLLPLPAGRLPPARLGLGPPASRGPFGPLDLAAARARELPGCMLK
jgi:hypothetical protein